MVTYDDIYVIFDKNNIACDGIISCDVDDWNKVACHIDDLHDRVFELTQALDLMVKQFSKRNYNEGDYLVLDSAKRVLNKQ